MKKEADKLKLEAEASIIALEEADKQLRVALEKAEAAKKKAETRALDQIKMLSEKTNVHMPQPLNLKPISLSLGKNLSH
ncbi:hypothetical protein CRYUN_Cryun12cG0108600 [Craigia yunnanensis]